MKFKKIQLGKAGTMNAVYVSQDGDIISLSGANITHKDFKDALLALVPHLALLTEQKEAFGLSLGELQMQADAEGGLRGRIAVTSVTISGDEIALSGTRILDRGDIIQVNSPKINVVDDERYEFVSELSLAIDNLKYEAEQYICERKWGLVQSEIDFEKAGDPFAGVEAGEVPDVTIEVKTAKSTKRPKKVKEVA